MTHKFGGNDLVTSRSTGYTGRIMATYPGENGREIMVKGVADVRTGKSPEPRVFNEKALRGVSFG